MHVLLINGSPHKNGCTYTALGEVAKGLAQGGVDSEMFQLGTVPVRGCIACHKCDETSRCVFDDDVANECLEAMLKADGVVVGSPVYYAGPNGALCAVLDRAFYAGGAGMAGKAAAAVVSCRRGGSSAALDRLQKYFTISQMPVVSSQYWNMVHGFTPDEVRRDEEGMQVMRMLGLNMAHLVKSLAAAGPAPQLGEKKMWTNFIR